LSSWMDASLAFLAWFVATEFFAQGIISRIPEWLVGVVGSLARVSKPERAGIKRWWANRQAKPAEAAAAAPNASITVKTLRLAVPTLVTLVSLVVLFEFPHYGKTVVEPFESPADGKQQPQSGRQLSLLVVEELNKVRRDVPELVILSNKTAGVPLGQRRFSSVPVALETSSMASAVSSSNDFEAFGLKIKLGSLVGLIQGPVRRLMGIEVVTGSLFEETGASGLSAVAVSSTGQTWRASEQASRAASKGRGCDDQGPVSLSPVESLAHELGFRIAASSPDSSLTQSVQAFDAFETGISFR